MAIGKTPLTHGTSTCCHVWLISSVWAFTPIESRTLLHFSMLLTSSYLSALHRIRIQCIFVYYLSLCGSAGRFTGGLSYFAWTFHSIETCQKDCFVSPIFEAGEETLKVPALLLDSCICLLTLLWFYVTGKFHTLGMNMWPDRGHARSCRGIYVCLLLSSGWRGPKFVPQSSLANQHQGSFVEQVHLDA